MIDGCKFAFKCFLKYSKKGPDVEEYCVSKSLQRSSKNTIMSVICWKNVLFGSYFELFCIIRYYPVLFGIKCNRCQGR